MGAATFHFSSETHSLPLFTSFPRKRESRNDATIARSPRISLSYRGLTAVSRGIYTMPLLLGPAVKPRDDRSLSASRQILNLGLTRCLLV